MVLGRKKNPMLCVCNQDDYIIFFIYRLWSEGRAPAGRAAPAGSGAAGGAMRSALGAMLSPRHHSSSQQLSKAHALASS